MAPAAAPCRSAPGEERTAAWAGGPLAVVAAARLPRRRGRRRPRVRRGDGTGEASPLNFVDPSEKGAEAGNAAFWTLLHFGRGRGVVALRDVVEQRRGDGELVFVALAGEGPQRRSRPAPEAADPLPSQTGTAGSVPAPGGGRSWPQRLGRWWRSRRLKEPLTAGAASDGAQGGQLLVEEAASPFLHERIRIRPGDGFGQFCKLTPDAEERLLTHYRSTSGVLGQSNGHGVCVSEATDIMPFLAPLLRGGPHVRMLSDSDIVAFKDVKDFRMPLGVEDNFKIHVCPMESAPQLQEEVKRHRIRQMRGLSFGLPSACDAFREAPFTGRFHGLGIVPAIDDQQFVMGSACPDAGFSWVRFDKDDLTSYDHDLEGVPVLEDDKGIFFPVTHLWVDFDFPTAAYALEWFCGTRCVVRKELSLWPMPNWLFQKIISITLGNLRDIA